MEGEVGPKCGMQPQQWQSPNSAGYTIYFENMFAGLSGERMGKKAAGSGSDAEYLVTFYTARE